MSRRPPIPQKTACPDKADGSKTSKIISQKRTNSSFQTNRRKSDFSSISKIHFSDSSDEEEEIIENSGKIKQTNIRPNSPRTINKNVNPHVFSLKNRWNSNIGKLDDSSSSSSSSSSSMRFHLQTIKRPGLRSNSAKPHMHANANMRAKINSPKKQDAYTTTKTTNTTSNSATNTTSNSATNTTSNSATNTTSNSATNTIRKIKLPPKPDNQQSCLSQRSPNRKPIINLSADDGDDSISSHEEIRAKVVQVVSPPMPSKTKANFGRGVRLSASQNISKIPPNPGGRNVGSKSTASLLPKKRAISRYIIDFVEENEEFNIGDIANYDFYENKVRVFTNDHFFDDDAETYYPPEENKATVSIMFNAKLLNCLNINIKPSNENKNLNEKTKNLSKSSAYFNYESESEEMTSTSKNSLSNKRPKKDLHSNMPGSRQSLDIRQINRQKSAKEIGFQPNPKNITESEEKGKIQTKDLKFYINSDPAVFSNYVRSFVPFYQMSQLKTQSVQIGIIYLKNEFPNFVDSIFPVNIGEHCSETPLSFHVSDPNSCSSSSTLSSIGECLEKLKVFPFDSEKLFPLEEKEPLKKLKTFDHKSDQSLNPYSFININDTPILEGDLKLKAKKSVTCHVALMANRISYNVNSCIELTCDSSCVFIEPKNFKVSNSSQVFECKNDSEAKKWVENINSLRCFKNVSVLNMHLFILSSHEHSDLIEKQIVSAITSPYLLFSLVLLNIPVFFEYVTFLYDILKSENRIDFFMRTIILAEFHKYTTSINKEEFDNDIFNGLSQYSNAMSVIFKSVSKDWLSMFALNFEKNNITKGVDLLNLVYSLFSLINKDGFYIVRCLMLYSCVVCQKEYHPMVPFFNLLQSSLDVNSKKKNIVFDDLKKALYSQSKSRLIYELVPFVNTIFDIIPQHEGNPRIENKAGEIYKFLRNNIDVFLCKHKDFGELYQKQNFIHPVVLSHYMNLLFLSRNA